MVHQARPLDIEATIDLALDTLDEIAADRAAYARQPERPDSFWTEAEAWSEE